jgi:hypothetical protein
MRVSPAPSGAHLEDATHDRSLIGVDTPLDVRPLAVRPEDLDVVVAEHTAAGNMAGACLPLHRVVRSLPCFLPLKLVGERGQRQHDLVGRRIERSLAVFEVEEDSHAGLNELLQRVRRLDGFAPETRFLRHDEHLERRARFQRIHQAQEARPVRKLGAADAVIDARRALASLYEQRTRVRVPPGARRNAVRR